jgi:topoisomerase IA-like protein
MPNERASSHDKEHPMATYGKKAEEKVEKAMHERKRGTLKSGGSGKTVTSRKQAIAIGLSEARAAGGKVPAKKSAAKKTAAKKTPAKKTPAKKTPAKKASAKKASAKKASAKKTTAKKSTARKST